MPDKANGLVSRPTSRRDFLKLSAAATGGAAVIPEISRSAWAAGSDVIRVGLIGAGLRATDAAQNALDADRGIKLVAIADLFADKIQASLAQIKEHARQINHEGVLVDKDHCFTGFDGYRHVIESSDVVMIACSSRFHPRYLREALEAGKHVFVEKPHGIDPVGARATQEACDFAKTKSLSVLSGLHNRYNPGVRETVKRIHDGAIGDVVSMEVNFLRAPYVLVDRQPGWSEIQYQYRNWYHFSWLSGDDVTQSLVHSLDKVAWIMHEEPPVKAHGLAGRSASFGPIYGDVFDHHSVVYEYANGTRVYAFCRTQERCHSGVSDYVFGTKGSAELLSYRIRGETNWDYAGPFDKPYKEEQKAFFAGIRSGQLVNSGDYMAKSTMLAILGQITCYTGIQMGWKKAAGSSFAFQPLDCNFETEPPVKPGPDGLYPVAVPGVTKLVEGT